MPASARKRKPKRRRSSSRKKARRRRTAPRTRVNPPSSDEDFVLDGNSEESSSGSTDQDDDQEDEEEEAEEESEDEEQNSRNEVQNSDSNVEFSARRHRQTSRSRNGRVNATSLSRLQRLGRHLGLEDDGTGGNANRASRVRRQHRRQDSSDEDFEVDIERILENSSTANEGVIASRPMTRAMDSCQVSNLGEGGQGNGNEIRGFTVNMDALQSGAGGTSPQLRNPKEGHAYSARRGCSVINDADKRKGKEKALEGEESAANVADEETIAAVCGICWTEMVAVERGKLNSCDHFFCFGCIMEWAKVESRCPMCKQRFTTIARSDTGLSKRMRTIRIPLRNQVYMPPEDPDLPPEDPYADVVCMECQGTGDEGLLLLCDRCDSAAHTFCVGLGRSVPRGDWYCRDCQALTGGMSSSEDEPEELDLASGDDDESEEQYDDDAECEIDDAESLLRSIVASVNSGSQRPRQTRVQRRSASTSSSLPLPRRVRSRPRRLRSRLWQRLSHRQRGSYIAAPRLSQAARALLSSTSSELNPAPHAPEALPNGSARTVPQQRRLHERINEMRNNWGRIQNGDLHFDALRTGAMGPDQQAVSSNLNGTASRTGDAQVAASSNSSIAPIGAASRTGATGSAQVAASSNLNIAPIAPTSSIASFVSDKRDVDFVERSESSTQGEKDVKRAWRMMGHAQNLTDGIGSNKSHPKKLGSSSSSELARATQPTGNTTSSATSNLIVTRKNLEIPTCNVPSPSLKNGNAGIYTSGSAPAQVFSNLKHDEIPLRQVPRPIHPSASIGECRKEDLPSSSNHKSPIGFDKDSSRPAGVKHTVDLASSQGFKPELSNLGRQFERKVGGITHMVTDNGRTKENRDISVARGNIVAVSLSSPPHEGLKVHLTELVKRQTWPVYITERLDKEQFKRIARAAVHSLLALCDPNNKSVSLSCVHFEDQGNESGVTCCNKCLDQHVEKAVKNAKDKIIPG